VEKAASAEVAAVEKPPVKKPPVKMAKPEAKAAMAEVTRPTRSNLPIHFIP
jgi:hypothetical protein